MLPRKGETKPLLYTNLRLAAIASSLSTRLRLGSAALCIVIHFVLGVPGPSRPLNSSGLLLSYPNSVQSSLIPSNLFALITKLPSLPSLPSLLFFLRFLRFLNFPPFLPFPPLHTRPLPEHPNSHSFPLFSSSLSNSPIPVPFPYFRILDPSFSPLPFLNLPTPCYPFPNFFVFFPNLRLEFPYPLLIIQPSPALQIRRQSHGGNQMSALEGGAFQRRL